jgi:hypothetical protein
MAILIASLTSTSPRDTNQQIIQALSDPNHALVAPGLTE